MSSHERCAPEEVDAVGHLARGEGGQRLDLRAGAAAHARRLRTAADFRVQRQAPAGVQQQADAQAAHLRAVEVGPVQRLEGQAGGVAQSGRLSVAISSAASATCV
jgi:transcriptional regulator of nitric oxide reductase